MQTIYDFYGVKPTGKGIPISALSGITFRSIYNGHPASNYSIGHPNSLETRVAQIYDSYTERANKEMQSKYSAFGGAEGFLDAIALEKNTIEKAKPLLSNMENKADNFSEVLKDYNKSTKELKEKKENNGRLEEETIALAEITKKLMSTAQEYIDIVGGISSDFYDKNRGAHEVVGGPQVSAGLAPLGSVQGAYTSMLNVKEQIKAMDFLLGDLNKFQDKITSSSNLEFVKFKSTGNVRKNEIEATKDSISMTGFANSISGSISTIKGAVLEIEATNALYNAIGEIYQEVNLLGEEDGVEVLYTSGEFDGDYGRAMKTSRTDVSFVSRINDMDITTNLSMKNQSISGRKNSGKKESTSLLTTSLLTMTKLISVNSQDAIALGSHLVLGQQDRTATDTQNRLTQFLVALTADFALASAGYDRVDFYIYRDGVVSRGKYYEIIKDNLSATISKKDEARKNYLDALYGKGVIGGKSAGSIAYSLSRA